MSGNAKSIMLSHISCFADNKITEECIMGELEPLPEDVKWFL